MASWAWLFRYLALAAPNVLLIVAALMLGLFPHWISELESDSRRRPLRYSIAGGIAVLALVLWGFSALQMHDNDVVLAELLNQQSQSYARIDRHISEFEAHTPTVPKVALRISEAHYTQYPFRGGTAISVDVTVVNDADDVTLTEHTAAAAGPTPSEKFLQQKLREMSLTLRAKSLGGPRLTLRHGESRVISSSKPVDTATVMGLALGTSTAIFGVIMDARTATGMHTVISFCSVYQDMILVNPDCPK
jgi:hypothetical protein